jgi:sporulation protein YunB
MRSRRRTFNKFKIILILALCIFAALLIAADRQLKPLIKALAYQKAHNIAVLSMERAALEQMEYYAQSPDYYELMRVQKDNEGRIVLMTADAVKINMIVSSIIVNTEKYMQVLEDSEINIPLGLLTGLSFFKARGPVIKVSVAPIGVSGFTLKEEFSESGINQTRHRIWLNMNYAISLAFPFDEEEITASTSVLISEGIIVGPIPETYMRLDE